MDGLADTLFLAIRGEGDPEKGHLNGDMEDEKHPTIPTAEGRYSKRTGPETGGHGGCHGGEVLETGLREKVRGP